MNTQTSSQTFANFSDLDKKTRNKTILIELSNGYYLPVKKNQIKKVADAMTRNEDKFCGDILWYSTSVAKISLTSCPVS